MARVYIPVVIMFVLGVLAAFKVGLVSNGYLGDFSWSKAFPDLEHIDSLKYLAGITFIFVGIEMSSVYMPRLKDATKNTQRRIYRFDRISFIECHQCDACSKCRTRWKNGISKYHAAYLD